MKFDIVNRAIVIVGKEYFPTAVTHEFLKNSKIVKKSWEQSEAPITTPVVSVVKYTNGIVFATEKTKLQIVDNIPSANEYKIDELGKKLVQKIINVRHIAVGLNIAALCDHAEPGKYVLKRFMKSGPWAGTDPQSGAVTYVYDFKQSLLTMTVDAGAYVKGNEQRDGLLITANYNIDLPAELSLEAAQKKVLDILNDYSSYYDHYVGIINALSLEDTNDYKG